MNCFNSQDWSVFLQGAMWPSNVTCSSLPLGQWKLNVLVKSCKHWYEAAQHSSRSNKFFNQEIFFFFKERENGEKKKIKKKNKRKSDGKWLTLQHTIIYLNHVCWFFRQSKFIILLIKCLFVLCPPPPPPPTYCFSPNQLEKGVFFFSTKLDW